MDEDKKLEWILTRKFHEILKRIGRGGTKDSMEDRETVIEYEVTDATFNKEVIEKSYKVPVVVDFWAPWCGPCYLLAPELETAIKTFNGKVLLAKLNIDENPITAGKYGIVNIPTVILFKDGKPVDYFVGAASRGDIIRWLKRNLF